jgi:hypothetical protein
MKSVFILLLLSLNLFSQNGGYAFEFNTRFIKEVGPFKDLSDDGFLEERKIFKIKSIKIITKVSQSLDNIYINNRGGYDRIINSKNIPIDLDHFLYSKVDFFDYNKLGLLVSFHQYPICSYLTKEDSLKFDHWIKKPIVQGNQIVFKYYIKDSLQEQLVFQNEKLMSRLVYSELYTNIKDSNNIYIPVYKGRKVDIYNYEYSKNGKINKTFLNNELILDYDYSINNEIKIRNFQIDMYDSTKDTAQNNIIRNRVNLIERSIFFKVNQPEFKIVYYLEYDKNNNISKIKRSEFDDKPYCYYDYKNFYEKNKLTKTIAHYNFNVVNNDVVYTYDEKGFVKTVSQGGRTEYFEYTFFDK